VSRNGQLTKVRLLGIDTPETVHPTEPVACYGPEASAFALEQLNGRNVVLEFDPSQPREDRYGRTLAYVWVDGAMFNLAALRDGYAERYRAAEQLLWELEFTVVESEARDRGTGLWGACPNVDGRRLP
jgi:micrococcal nuclease